MNLNPLKKDSNTDALVKALEDANGAGADPMGAQPAAGSGPQSTPAESVADPATPPVETGATAPSDATAPDDSKADEAKDKAETDLTFSGDDLPGNLTSDADAHLPGGDASGPASSDNKDLDSVKKSALEQLRPLIEKIKLEPVEKFDKYLMMLRASDDPTLIEPAFKAAEQIPGEEEKAQALLDIINEINYITASKQQ